MPVSHNRGPLFSENLGSDNTVKDVFILARKAPVLNPEDHSLLKSLNAILDRLKAVGPDNKLLQSITLKLHSNNSSWVSLSESVIHVSIPEINSLPTDDLKAFVLGHELGHLLSMDVPFYKGPYDNSLADLVGLILVKRAGYTFSEMSPFIERMDEVTGNSERGETLQGILSALSLPEKGDRYSALRGFMSGGLTLLDPNSFVGSLVISELKNPWPTNTHEHDRRVEIGSPKKPLPPPR